jgi:hypothetical protein
MNQRAVGLQMLTVADSHLHAIDRIQVFRNLRQKYLCLTFHACRDRAHHIITRSVVLSSSIHVNNSPIVTHDPHSLSIAGVTFNVRSLGEIIERELQGQCRFQIVPFLRECVVSLVSAHHVRIVKFCSMKAFAARLKRLSALEKLRDGRDE